MIQTGIIPGTMALLFKDELSLKMGRSLPRVLHLTRSFSTCETKWARSGACHLGQLSGAI
jgi:hypothetical protein